MTAVGEVSAVARSFLVAGAPPDAGASRERVGAKAHGLARMTRLGLPVPAAFALDTACCREVLAAGGSLTRRVEVLLTDGVRRLERLTGRRLGCNRRPLLLSVRSGAAVSMPGMMDSLLNVGLCDATVNGLIRLTGNPRLAWDGYRRLVQGWAEVVAGCRSGPFERVTAEAFAEQELDDPRDLDGAALERLTHEYLELVEALAEEPFPQSPEAQLAAAVAAVFRSWNSPRAVDYRRLNGIDESLGTAVTVQAMVFGNAGGTSGSGVGFTRNPATGERGLYVDFLFNAQGEDVVSGRGAVDQGVRLPLVLPAAHRTIVAVAERLERELGDLQDFEFTIENGVPYLLQVRPGKRTPWAALHIAVDLVEEGLISPAEAVARLADLDLEVLERVVLVIDSDVSPIARATPASIGVAVGEIALDVERVQRRTECGEPVILVREQTSTYDIVGMSAAEGVLTATGGRTSHASVVARQLGKVCLVGCDGLQIDLERRRCSFEGRHLAEGEVLSIDGDRGLVYAGRMPVERWRPEAALASVRRWRQEMA